MTDSHCEVPLINLITNHLSLNPEMHLFFYHVLFQRKPSCQNGGQTTVSCCIRVNGLPSINWFENLHWFRKILLTVQYSPSSLPCSIEFPIVEKMVLFSWKQFTCVKVIGPMRRPLVLESSSWLAHVVCFSQHCWHPEG